MLKRLGLAACCALLLLGAGCATLSKTECLNGDWEQIGLEDGNDGYRSERIEDHREACSEYGVVANLFLYRRGRERGLLNYCTPAKGYAEGKRGATYRNVCPADLESGFLHNYHIGMQIYELNRQIREVEGRIHAKEKELRKDNLSEERHHTLRDHIRDLEREKSNLQYLLHSTEWMVHY